MAYLGLSARLEGVGLHSHSLIRISTTIVPNIKAQRILNGPTLSQVPLLPEYNSPMVVNISAVDTLRVIIDHVTSGSATKANAKVAPDVGARIMVNAPIELSAAANPPVMIGDSVRRLISLRAESGLP